LGLISRTAYTAGQTVTASGQNTNENTIVNEINGNIDNDNIKSGAAIAASKLNLTSIAQVMAHSVAMNWAKGSDIASATTTDIGAATGNYVHVTGTTTITGLGTVQSGTWRMVRFTGALTFTHNATSLILPTAANITTAADDHALMVSLGSGNWICASYTRKSGVPLVAFTASSAPSGTQLQKVSTQSGAVDTSTTTVNFDDSIPQVNAEGESFSAIETAITPNNSSNYLDIDIVLNVSSSVDGGVVCLALAQDSTAASLNAVAIKTTATGTSHQLVLHHRMTAGTTSATTFKAYYGPATAGTVTVNGSAGGRLLGGVQMSSITITETKA